MPQLDLAAVRDKLNQLERARAARLVAARDFTAAMIDQKLTDEQQNAISIVVNKLIEASMEAATLSTQLRIMRALDLEG